MTKFQRFKIRIKHWLRGYHENDGRPVRDVEHCDQCNEKPEPLNGEEGC